MTILKHRETRVTKIREGAERRIGHTDNLMIVVVDFYDGPKEEPDPPHSHPHEQVCYVADGEIAFFMDGQETRLGAGDVFKDTHQLSHFQFCPVEPTLATFCHEGPWHLVTQRIWLLDFVSHEAWPCFRQGEQDSIGHEFWTQDGYVFFDDRGPGTMERSRRTGLKL